MKRISQQFFILAAVTMFAAPIYAQGIYAGVSVGQAQADDACSDFRDIGFVGSCDDDTGWAWKGYVGYQLTPNWGVEAFYSDFGEVLDGTGNVNIDAESDAYGLAAVGRLPLTDQFSVFGKVGFASWDVDANFSVGALSASGSDDGTDVLFGVGAAYNITNNISARAEWEYIDDLEIRFFSAGLVYKFY